MIVRIGLLAILFFSLAPGPTKAGPFEDGLEAYNRSDYRLALRLWSPLAVQGFASAQFNLGLMHFMVLISTEM